ncbi:MAG: outer membrane beta-barrel protein [bacterium]|nr:outer membrane beta-barrel protein [bacterium]
MKSKLFLIAALACALAIPASAGPLADATSDMLWGIEIGGYIDIGSTYNLNDPATDMNSYRVFDTDDGDFVDFHALQFSFDKLPEDCDEVGFRVDMMYGEDAALVGGGSGVLDDGNLNIYQAYISYIAPIGNGLTIDLGRFATWHGYEVIESGLNDQFSRSFLFGYAIPFTHTGARFTYTINEMWEVGYSLTQGWDTVEDNNDSLTHHIMIRTMPTEQIYIQNSLAYGPEMPGDNGSYTLLYDLVGTYQATEQFLIGANFDWGQTEDYGVGGGDADWWGIAGYLRYDVNDKFYAAVRGEWMNDEDNLRLGAPLIAPDTDVELWEVTLTLGYEVVDGLLTRVEYRHDDADSDIFVDDSGLDNTQDTISLEVIYSF